MRARAAVAVALLTACAAPTPTQHSPEMRVPFTPTTIAQVPPSTAAWVQCADFKLSPYDAVRLRCSDVRGSSEDQARASQRRAGPE